jgi:predicted  nucleic acid-binding Zn-ribbon protein
MLQRIVLVVLTCIALVGCESAYYSAMEKVGLHKRDILVDRVEDVRDSQVDVKEQFASALERFTAELNFDGGELEKVYKALDGEYQDSLSRAEELSADIDRVEDVADDLFKEWQNELDQYSNASLKRQSAAQLRETKAHYKKMLSAMHSAEEKMFPVLETLHDQVLFLKHNLNARAIASLKGEFGSLKRDVQRLIADMEASIKASEKFMETLQ